MTSDNNVTGYLELVTSDGVLNAPARITLEQEPVSMGRGVGNTVIWSSIQISRAHSVMEFIDEKWNLKDLSTNGLIINRQKIPKGVFVPLRDFDIITFIPTGALVYRFVEIKPAPIIPVVDLSPDPQLQMDTQNLDSLSPKRKTDDDDELNEQDRKRKRIIVHTTEVGSTEVGSSKDNNVSVESTPDFYSAIGDIGDSSPDRSRSPSLFKPFSADYQYVAFSQDDKDEITLVKQELKAYQEKIEELEIQNNKFKLEKNQDVFELKTKIANAQTEIRVFKDDLYKKVMDLMDHEFSCSICSEIFIDATVTDCGHTFCNYCIAEWGKMKPECPNCRKPIKTKVKHVEMDNFVVKFHSMLSEDIQKRREQILEDRQRETLLVKVPEPSASSSSRGGLSLQEMFPPNNVVELLIELQQMHERAQAGRGRSRAGPSNRGHLTVINVNNNPTVTTRSAAQIVVRGGGRRRAATRGRRGRGAANPVVPNPPPNVAQNLQNSPDVIVLD